MQPEYPYYSLHSEAGMETGLDIELRVAMGVGGPLTGLQTADAVVDQLVANLTAAGAATISITKHEVVNTETYLS